MKKFICFLLVILLVISSISFSFASEQSPARIGEKNNLNVPLYQQSQTYTCGPACIRMALKKFGISKSESTLTSQLGTTKENGTYVYKVKDCLNSNLGKNSYKYYLTDNTDFDNKVLASIKAGYPVICHVKPKNLPNYVNQRVPEGHYIVVSGYTIQKGAITQISLTYNDPHYDNNIFGTYNVSSSEMKKAINYRAHYYISY